MWDLVLGPLCMRCASGGGGGSLTIIMCMYLIHVWVESIKMCMLCLLASYSFNQYLTPSVVYWLLKVFIPPGLSPLQGSLSGWHRKERLLLWDTAEDGCQVQHGWQGENSVLGCTRTGTAVSLRWRRGTQLRLWNVPYSGGESQVSKCRNSSFLHD